MVGSAPASAHDMHECYDDDVDSNGFDCYHDNRHSGELRHTQYIHVYYNGDRRGTVEVIYSGVAPFRAFEFLVCDWDTGDTTDPRIRIQSAQTGLIYEFADRDSSGCDEIPVDMSVDRVRALNRNLSGDINHGTAWFDSLLGP